MVVDEPVGPIYADVQTVADLAAVAGLPLSEDQRATVLAGLRETEKQLRLIRGLELGETPPATAFQASWW